MKAVYIEWVDSATRRGWDEADGGALYVDQMTIPRVAIKKIRRLPL